VVASRNWFFIPLRQFFMVIISIMMMVMMPAAVTVPMMAMRLAIRIIMVMRAKQPEQWKMKMGALIVVRRFPNASPRVRMVHRHALSEQDKDQE